MEKQYGLIVPGSNQKPTSTLVPKPSIFVDSDSDDDLKKNIPTVSQKPRYQDIIAQQKALAEDPTVYQYDEVYDEIENKRKESKLARKDIDRKPKYINKLLQTAARRKREYESRIEREVQKERQAEGDEFKDKESFVTSSYRKKLEEMRELREQEKREEYLESIGDVTKQSDLGGFYRHLYEQQVKNIDENVKNNTESTSLETKQNEEVEEIKVETENESNVGKESKKSSVKKRKYRKRGDSEKSSDSDNNEEKSNKKLQHLPSNLDADSDFSIDSSDNENVEKEKPIDVVENIEVSIKEEKEPEIDTVITEQDTNNELKKDDKPLEFEPEVKEEPLTLIETKHKFDIWKKRTVGEVFDEALKKYYARKSARMGSV